jgi:RimJ/RimL family protein N-acetyltransferase
MDVFKPPSIIETDVLTLRPFVADDARVLFETMLGDETQMTWLSMRRHRSVHDSLLYIRAMELEWLAGTGFTWALVERESGALIAAIELHVNRPRAELGVMTSTRATPRQRRAGLSALLKLIRWLLAQPQLYRVHAYCAPESAAASTMRRLGFTLEGRLANWLWLPNTQRGVGDALSFSICRPPAADAAAPDSVPATAPRAQRRPYDRVARAAHAARLARLGGFVPAEPAEPNELQEPTDCADPAA